MQENPGTTNQIKDSFLYGDLLIIFFKTGELQKHDLNGQTREEGTWGHKAFTAYQREILIYLLSRVEKIR